MSKNHEHKEAPLKIEHLHPEEIGLPDEAIQMLRTLANALIPPYRRTLTEGYVMENGRLIKQPIIEL